LSFPKFLNGQLPLSPGISLLMHNRRKNKKLVEKRISYFTSIRHGSHRKRRVRQFLYCCMCSHCSGKVFNEPLPSNDAEGTHTDTQTDGRDL
jgi:hypothetical protein